MAKQPRVFDGTQWQELAVQVPNMSNYAYLPTTPVSGFRNAIINGDFRINQRGFSSTTTYGAFGFDRWLLLNSGGTSTYSAQAFTAGNPISGQEPVNYARLVTASQSSAGDYACINQGIEDVRTFAGRTVTISFWAKASTGTPNIGVSLEQIFGTGGSTPSVVTSPEVLSINSSWNRYSFVINVPSISGKTIGTSSQLRFLLFTSAGTTISALGYAAVGVQNITVDFWGVQIEAGSVATPFEQRPIGTELALCQRYYWRVSSDANNTYAKFATGVPNSATVGYSSVPHPVPMRIPATSVDYANMGFVNFGLTNYAISSLSIASNSLSTNSTFILFNSTGMTAGQFGWIQANNSSSGYIGFSAEL